MKKKIIIGLVFFLIGIGLSICLESSLRSNVLSSYQWTTNDGIQFVGKNFFLFTSPIYYLGFGISFSIMAIDCLSKSVKQVIIIGTIGFLIFVFATIGLSALDANSKIIECTACNNGIRKLRYNEVNHGLILGISIILSGIPSVIRLLKIKK